VSELSDDVVFDYGGALELARQLWELADGWEAAFTRRSVAGSTALATARGPLVQELAARSSADGRASEEVGRKLRQEANRWAKAWTDAVNERDLMIQAQAGVAGASVPAPELAAVPAPPGFEPTVVRPWLGR
jgi:hypothetical protein